MWTRQQPLWAPEHRAHGMLALSAQRLMFALLVAALVFVLELVALLPMAATASAATIPGTVYVVNRSSDSITPIDVPSNAIRPNIAVGHFPGAIAVTPNGATAFVTNSADGTEVYAKTSLKKCRPIAARNEDKKVFSGLL